MPEIFDRRLKQATIDRFRHNRAMRKKDEVMRNTNYQWEADGMGGYRDVDLGDGYSASYDDWLGFKHQGRYMNFEGAVNNMLSGYSPDEGYRVNRDGSGGFTVFRDGNRFLTGNAVDPNVSKGMGFGLGVTEDPRLTRSGSPYHSKDYQNPVNNQVYDRLRNLGLLPV